MWKIEIPLPDDTRDDVITAFCAAFNYSEEVTDTETGENIPNPLSKEDFLQDQLAYYILKITVEHLTHTAKAAAYAAAVEEAEAKAAAAMEWYDQYRIDNPKE